MIRVQTDTVTYFQFPHLLKYPQICHGVLSRHGGCSKGNFESMNVSAGVGDDVADVRCNRKILGECFDQKPLIFVCQVHGDQSYIIRNVSELPSSLLVADALITNISGINLVIQVADCQALILFDPVKNVVANVHSGWRGSILNIAGKTVRRMISEFGSVPENILAGIGPSLGPCCAEFINYKSEIPTRLWQYRIKGNYFDFWAMSRNQLVSEGILSDNIVDSKRCTVCNTKDFFSYRAEKITGRFASVVGLIP